MKRLRTVKEVEAWGAELRAERLNDTGRGLIDLATELLRSAVELAGDGIDPDSGLPHRLLALRAIAPHVDKAVRASFVADKGEAERALVALRRRAEAQDTMAAGLDEMH